MGKNVETIVIISWQTKLSQTDQTVKIQSDFKFTAFDIDPQQESVYVLDEEGRLQRYSIDIKI